MAGLAAGIPPNDGGPPTGAAAGDLAGSYPSPTVKASVGLTGVPTAPTAAVDTNTTQIATMAAVLAALNVDYATYKYLIRRGAGFAAATASTILMTGDALNALTVNGALPLAAGSAFYIQPADFAAGTRTTKLRIRADCIVNATAPAVDFTVGLYPVATWGGAAGSNPTIATIGAVIAGSTVAYSAPAAAGPVTPPLTSGDFTAPAAGWYVLAVAVSGSQAANSQVYLHAELQVRQV